MNEQETVADIIAEKRRQADKIERDVAEKMKRGEMTSDQYARELVADIRREADRLDAAHKREKAALEADALAVGGIVEAERQRKRGDCAKMREVMNRVHDYLGELIRDNLVEDTPRASDLADDVYDAIHGSQSTEASRA